MSQNLSRETVCVQGGWQPKNGEARVLPIYQSTTFNMKPANRWGASLTWRKTDISIRAWPIPPMTRCGKDLCLRGRRGGDADFLRPGGKHVCGSEYLLGR